MNPERICRIQTSPKFVVIMLSVAYVLTMGTFLSICVIYSMITGHNPRSKG